MITAIIAISENFAIGREGKLPWHYPEDLKFFKQTTTGHAIVMGSNTWRSIGRPLPERLNIVLSRSGGLELPPEVIRLRSKEQAVALSKYLDGGLYLIGGAQVYADFADVIDRWLVTSVPVVVEDADTYMPPNFLSGYTVKGELELSADLTVKIFRRPDVSGV